VLLEGLRLLRRHAAEVVYCANDLKSLERARTEWPAAAGVTLSARRIEHYVVFVVHRLGIDYRRPARLGDSLTVTLLPVEGSRVRPVVAQDILRNDGLISSARVTLARLDARTWRPLVIADCVPGRNRCAGRPETAAPMENPS
jgi:acyl-CoA thioester hydrolase